MGYILSWKISQWREGIMCQFDDKVVFMLQYADGWVQQVNELCHHPGPFSLFLPYVEEVWQNI